MSAFGRRRMLGLGLAFLVTAACEKLDTPSDPVWGKEPCAHCRMLVSERRFAAQAVANGERRYFDDIGCLVLWSAEHRTDKAWVRDAEGNRWLEAASARYASGARTPMDFGFEGRAPETEGTLGFQEMRATVLARANGTRSER